MAKAARCYYTGRKGLKCETCVLSEQQYCGNYVTHPPYFSITFPKDAPQETKGSSLVKIVRALEQMGFKKR